MAKLSPHCQLVLNHLSKLKPNDGWSIEPYISAKGELLMTLNRGNVPVCGYVNGEQLRFKELILDSSSGCVVGVTSYIRDSKKYGKGPVLVEKDGSMTGGQQQRELRVTLSDAKVSLKEFQAERANNVERASRISTSTQNKSNNMDQELVYKIVFLSMLAYSLLRLVTSFIYFVVIPGFICYLLQTCPVVDSFEPKVEMKRVLRGDNLPENHPNKPSSSFLSQTFARVKASVSTEIATSLGYEVSLQTFYGLFIIANVRVQSMNSDLYWIGALDKWTFVYQRDLTSTTPAQT